MRLTFLIILFTAFFTLLSFLFAFPVHSTPHTYVAGKSVVRDMLETKEAGHSAVLISPLTTEQKEQIIDYYVVGRTALAKER